MAVTIRRAIDAVPYLYAANPDLNVSAYAGIVTRSTATCRNSRSTLGISNLSRLRLPAMVDQINLIRGNFRETHRCRKNR
jgi:hypothetical protein